MYSIDNKKNYNSLLEIGYEKLLKKTTLNLPRIAIEYKFTFTHVYNFISVTNYLKILPDILGEYIKNELGMRSYTIKQNILSLKGRTNLSNIEQTIKQYIKEEKLCNNCGGTNTFKIKIMNVKKIKCNDCIDMRECI